MGRFAKVRLTAEERAAKKLRRHEHLRQIKQSFVHKEAVHGDFFHAGDPLLKAWFALVPADEPVLVAADPRHLRLIEEQGLRALWHVDQPLDPDDVALGRVPRKPEAAGPLQRLKFNAPLGAAFVCSRLQKQPNVHDYLTALRRSVKIDAPVALCVPNAHHELINDHVNLFTAGTLVYALVRAGWNCRNADVKFDKRFINVLLRRVDVPDPPPTTVDGCAPYMPFKNVFNYCSSEFPEVYRYELAPGRWS